jgi:NAD(P)H-dependent flavin oxidoreductase YrpB (nitropropane dioxygenase family)
MFKTKMTELFGIKHPIMLAGMNWITDPNMVSKVCNAGGLGILATARYTADEFRKCIKEIKTLTDKPFGINQMLMMPGAQENIKIAIEEKVPVINYTLGKPWFIDQVHGYGGKVLGTTALAKHAVKAQELGCDAIVITGHEAAAHGADATSLVLIPTVASCVKIPIVAAGGFYDGRGLAAALSLGAEGVNMGTRFLATREAPVHDRVKQALVERDERSTRLALRSLRNTVRVLHNAVVDRILEIEGRPGPTDFAELAPLVSGQVARERVWQQGDVDGGVFTAGQVTGLIHDIPTVADLVGRIVAEAEAIIRDRLPGLLA